MLDAVEAVDCLRPKLMRPRVVTNSAMRDNCREPVYEDRLDIADHDNNRAAHRHSETRH